MDIEQVEVNPLKRAMLPNAAKIIDGIVLMLFGTFSFFDCL